MQTAFTHAYMQLNCGCYKENGYAPLFSCSFMQKDTVLLNDILHSEIPLKHKYWFVCKKLLTGEQNQQVAIGVAEIVLPIYERRYHADKRPREAVEAAKQYIAGHISLSELLAKHRAAIAAADAAADAYAIAAADAAYAAAIAAYAAAADAYAAAAAAESAAYAYADIKKQLFQFLLDFVGQHSKIPAA